MAVHLGGPGADLEAEGDGHRLLAVGPADHRRGAVGPGQVTEQFFQPFDPVFGLINVGKVSR